MPPTAQHIAIVFHDFSFGGTEVIALRLAAEWVRRGRRVTILCGTLDGPLRAMVPPGVHVIALNPEVGRSLLSRFRLRKLLTPAIARLRADILFLPGNFHLILAGAVRGLAKPPKVIAKISNPLAPSSYAPLRRAIGWAYRRVARDADCLVAMSSGLATEARHLTESDNVEVIFDPNVELAGAAGRPKFRPAATGPLRLLAAGRLVPQKDFTLAIRTLAQLSQDCDVNLTILGEGPERGRLERLANRLGVKDRLFMPGHASSIIPALQKADILFITSRYEGGPAVAVEALSQGVPVISTDCSHFLHDLLDDERYGMILDTRSATKMATALSAWVDRRNPDWVPQEAKLTRFTTATAGELYLQLFDRFCLS